MSLIVVGSVAYDGVETPHGKVDRMLGGACTYISLAAAYHTEVKIVGVVGEDFAQEDIDFLASRNIDLAGLDRVAGKTFFWAGKYSPDMNDRETLRTDLNVFADFNPKLPESYRAEPYLFLGNIQPDLQRSVRNQMSHVQLTGGDTMNYWINDFRPALLETLKQWDFLLINDSEARLLSGEHNLRRAACKIMDMGPHTLVIKRGEYGAILFRRDQPLHGAWLSAGRRLRPHRRGRLLRRRLHRLPGRPGRLALQRRSRVCRTPPRRHLRFRDGQLLLREVRRGPLPHPDP